jgi:hypothetical protein
MQLASRFVFDAHVAGQVFERLTRTYDDEAYAVALEGMAVLYDAFCPAPEKKDP